MSNDYFRFKRFSINQSATAMKVGTDGVLLGAWTRVCQQQKRYLDVGTGTGLIALMIAQRSEENGGIIDAVEIDQNSARQATQNVQSSDWGDRINIYHSSLQDFAASCEKEGYDHIISNPPYFVDSMLPPDTARATARHAGKLPYAELAVSASVLLKEKGLLTVILPADGHKAFVGTAGHYGLNLLRVMLVRPLPDAEPKRVLMEFVKSSPVEEPLYEELVIQTGGPDSYTGRYKELTRDFYIRF